MAKTKGITKTAWKELQTAERKAVAERKRADKLKLDGGISNDEVKRIRQAIRQVWQWSSIARKNCLKRATDSDGFGHCENPECKKKVPKLMVDHLQVMGSPLAPDYIARMWCNSKHLQALCKKCHDKKTKEERKADGGQAKPKRLFCDLY